MWNKYPCSARRSSWCSLLGLCLLVAWLLGACLSNPTPHPGVSDTNSTAHPGVSDPSSNGVIGEGPEAPPGGGMANAVEDRSGHDTVTRDHDGDDDAEDADDVGPEDGGGSTEPMG